MTWFVMLRSVSGTPIPLIDLEDDIVVFASEEEAREAGCRNIIGESFGFEAYEWGR